ncbi:FGGY-family carbohydrate kinase [Synechococcus sp. CBW1107]|uniref:FGGY-family carbohydrate kinase n=1 Tax=Synechococcus sp. CBW1107 TaxID=2789857 RepID=UPI0018CFC2F0|nr:FGGY-family carbohydrate kinase [Synechococcus sp. CBW1107]QPN55701.1 FGGY-family carbohydrate kinase [Synechococcus sp. CBW1107]
MPVRRGGAEISALAAGVDLGSSGIRLVVIDARGEVLAELATAYPGNFDDPDGWRQGLITLVQELPVQHRHRLGSISLDGTSGTLLACRSDGTPLGPALAYNLACPEQAGALSGLVPAGCSASSVSGSLARALRLLGPLAGERAGTWAATDLLLRHQADWLMGWLLGDWRWGEEGNNLRLGWDLRQRHWSGDLKRQAWAAALPEVVASGRALGTLAPGSAAALGLPDSCLVVAGSTDANAAVLAADPAPGDGVTVLGTTLVLKQFVTEPMAAPGLSCHRLGGRWLVGGASNAGGGVLRRFFNDAELERLSRQIDPSRPSGLEYRPLPSRGERFPVDDPDLLPILEPRPVSDVLFLQGLLEGLARIEAQGWARLRQLGAPPLQRVISLGGGARNPQWRQLRQQAIGLPVLNRPGLAPALGMARLALSALTTPAPKMEPPSPPPETP